MKNFTKKFQYKSILALLVLLPVILLLSVTFTMSKYVTEKKVGNLTLNLTSIDVQKSNGYFCDESRVRKNG